jgi:GNAT superfamily N-acetyltransferase
MIEVRTAQIGDGLLLLEATRNLARHHGWEDTVTSTAADLEGALFAPHAVIGALLAFDGLEFAGSIIWHRSFSTNRGRPVIYLEDLLVLPGHRRKGVADALMKALAILAVRDSYSSIFWVMMNWNEGAKEFYSKLGAEVEADCSVYHLHGNALKALAT